MKKKQLLITLSILLSGFYTLAANLSTPEITGHISLHDIAADGSKIYYACAVEEDEKQIRFFEFAQNIWKEILLPADTKASSWIDVQVFNSVPYILFSESEGVTLIKYENGQWFHVGKPKFSSHISILGNISYLMVQDKFYVLLENTADENIEINILEREDNLEIWTNPDVSEMIPSDIKNPFICADLNNSVYTAWYNLKNQTVQVSKLTEDESTLQDMSKGILSKNISGIEAFMAIGNQLYLVITDQSNDYQLILQRYNQSASKWEVLATPALKGSNLLITEKLDLYLRTPSQSITRHLRNTEGWLESETLFDSQSEMVHFGSNQAEVYAAFLDANNAQKLIIQKY